MLYGTRKSTRHRRLQEAASLSEHTVRVADGLFVTVGPEARIPGSDCKRQKANTQASIFLPFAGLAFDDCMAARL